MSEEEKEVNVLYSILKEARDKGELIPFGLMNKLYKAQIRLRSMKGIDELI